MTPRNLDRSLAHSLADAACVLVAVGLSLSAAGTAQPPAAPASDPSAPSAAAASALAQGDAAWARRGEGQSNGQAATAPIAEAVAAYESALAAEPRNLETRARLLRALWFQGAYAAAGDDAKQKIFDHGKTVGEAGMEQLAATAGGRARFDDLAPAAAAQLLAARPGAAQVVFWTGVHWGLWGDAFGKFAAARQGVAGKIRDRCLLVLAMDDRMEEGGGHRVLGRLHALAPHVPFFTGWIDRKTAIAQLRQALAIGPDDPLNRQYLAEALLEYGDAAGQAEGRKLLQGILDHPLDPSKIVEWAAAQAQAANLLRGGS